MKARFEARSPASAGVTARLRGTGAEPPAAGRGVGNVSGTQRAMTYDGTTRLPVPVLASRLQPGFQCR